LTDQPTPPTPPADPPPTETPAAPAPQPLNIADEMKESYLNYAMSVIVARALPDVRDGLKPSQRRVLVAMNDLNLGPAAATTKCASIVGETMKRYHPHGEQTIYPTLVRLAQDWNLRYCLVHSQGNFGSIAGLAPAAMRYTEARLTAVAAEMLADLDHETVDFGDNYDGKYREPLVLPSKFPNLLVNGSDGIAVGMATDIPPHNLAEVCTSLIRLIDNPDVGLLGLMADGDDGQGIQGPDFPTGGEVYNYRGLLDAYATGRGKITLQARAEIIEDDGPARIVIHEVPYQQTLIRLTETIAQLVRDERIAGVNDVRDESSERQGIPVQIVIYLKRKADPQLILNQLYEFSPLRKTVSIINLALVDGRPEVLPLKRMLEEFLRHRAQVIRRRTEYLLREAKRRSHLLEGNLIAVASLDEVIRICRNAPSRAEAKVRLQGLEVSAGLMAVALGEVNFRALQAELGSADSYRMTEVQADAVVRMQLGQLAALERDEIMKEYRELRQNITEYERLLSSDANVLAVVRADLEHLRDRYGDVRKTTIHKEDLGSMALMDLVEEQQMAVTLTHNGYIKRLPLTTYRTQHRGGRGVSGGGPRDDDFVEHFFTASTHDYLLCFTNRGQLYWLKVYDIPEQGRTSAGRYIAQVLSLRDEEKISSILAIRDFEDEEAALLMATRLGTVKKTPLKDYSRPKKGGIIGISLDEGDGLVGVALVRPGDEVVLCTRQGMAIRFDESQARAMGRNTRGVKGITLKKTDDEVVGLVVARPDEALLTVSANGFGKRTPFGANTASDVAEADEAEPEVAEVEPAEGDEAAATGSSFYYRKQKRGGKGIISIKVNERNGPVVGVASVNAGDQVILITSGGMVNRTRVDEIRTAGRNTQGVKIMTPRDGDRIVSVVRVPPEPIETAEASPEVPAVEAAPETPSEE